MAAGPVTIPLDNLVLLFDGTFDLDTDVFRAALFNSSFSTATRFYSTTNEIAGVNGYTQGGALVDNITLGEVAGVVTFDADPVAWNAVGGPIAARYAVLYKVGGGNPILGYVLLDTTPADVTVTDGNSLTITWAANGIIRVTQA
jgi:hypothetical protein